MEIYVHDGCALVSWGIGSPVWALSKDGLVTEQRHVQGDLVWASGEPGFDLGYQAGLADGAEEALRAS